MKTFASFIGACLCTMLCVNFALAQKVSSYSGIYIAEPEQQGDPTILVIDMQAKNALLYVSRGPYRVGEEEVGTAPIYPASDRRRIYPANDRRVRDRYEITVQGTRYQLYGFTENRLKLDIEKPGGIGLKRFRKDRTLEFAKLNTENDDGTLSFINETGQEVNLYLEVAGGMLLMRELTWWEEVEMPSLKELTWVAKDEQGEIGRFNLEGNQDEIKILDGSGQSGSNNRYARGSGSTMRTTGSRGSRPSSSNIHNSNADYTNTDIDRKVGAFREITALMEENYQMKLRLIWEEQLRQVQQNVNDYHYYVMNTQFDHLVNGMPQTYNAGGGSYPSSPYSGGATNATFRGGSTNPVLRTSTTGGQTGNSDFLSIMFGNSTEFPLELFAFDKDGPKYVATLQPGEVSIQPAFLGQKWGASTPKPNSVVVSEYTVAQGKNHSHTFTFRGGR